MDGVLYIISGASGSGKTTMLNSILSAKLVKMAPKYSERPVRKLADGVTDDPNDDIVCIKSISNSKCDIKYVINGRYYGVNTKEVSEILNSGHHCAVVLSDLRVVRKLKSKMAGKVVSLYISSNISPDKLDKIHSSRHPFSPTDQQIAKLKLQFSRLSSALKLKTWSGVANCMRELLDDWGKYLPESQSIKIRGEKIRLFHNRYIDNIDLFDHVILNYNEPQQMMEQFSNISNNYPSSTKSSLSYPPIFFLAAASGAGKGTLMSHINLIGSSELKIVTKYALREEKPTDRRDGMVALGAKGKLPQGVDWKWIFHKGSTFKGIQYGVISPEIDKNLKQGTPQILVSNIAQLENAFSKYKDHIVPIYLHSTRSLDEVKEYQYSACRVHEECDVNTHKKRMEEAETRLEGIKQVHENYISNIHKFSHVILNTTYQEDMYDQVFSLLESYARDLPP